MLESRYSWPNMGWVQGTPKFDKNSEEDICVYVDKCIYYSSEVKDGEKPFLLFQIHKYTQTCMKVKKWQESMSFWDPLSPMSKTQILHPLTENERENVGEYKELYSKIHAYLDQFKSKPPAMSFKSFCII